MKYYLAARYDRKDEMMKKANELNSYEGFECTASWVYGGEEGKTWEYIHNLDLGDVRESDTLILFTEPYGSLNRGGGRFVEFGYALALGIKCIVIGEYEMVFCHGPEVQVFPDWGTFLHHVIPPSEKKV